jgi:hypothetical protein
MGYLAILQLATNRCDLEPVEPPDRLVSAADGVSDGGVDSVGRRAHDLDDTISVFTHVIPFGFVGTSQAQSPCVRRRCARADFNRPAHDELGSPRFKTPLHRSSRWRMAIRESGHHGVVVIRFGAGTFEKIMSASVSSRVQVSDRRAWASARS